MLGDNLLCAPVLSEDGNVTFYLPAGKWIDYQSGKVYEGGYRNIATGKIPCVILVRDGSIIPHALLAQRTDQIRWDKIEMKHFRSADNVKCSGIVYRPGDEKIEIVK